MDVTLQEWQLFEDRHHLVSDRKGTAPGNAPSTHNGLMFSIYKAQWLAVRAKEYPKHRMRLIQTYLACKAESGINRVPNGWPIKSLQQNDDLYACGLFDCWMGTDLSDHILASHRLNGGFIDNRDPDKKTWKAFIFRMPQLKTHLKVCSPRESPGPYESVIWSLWLIIGALRLKHRDSRVKAWCAVKAFAIRREELRIHPLIREIMTNAASFWVKRFLKKFPGGVGQSEYFFKGKDPDKPWVGAHVNTKYMWDSL